MKLEFLSFDFDKFAAEMASLKEKKGFDYLITIVGEDFGEEGLGCIYILENTKTHERCSVKMMAKCSVCGDGIAANGTGDTDGITDYTIPTDGRFLGNSDRVYDLHGRRMSTSGSGSSAVSLQRGIYIVNGKKMIIQ